MASSNITHLRENGPSTADDLPNGNPSTHDKQNGVWRFNHQTRAKIGGESEIHPRAVYYLRGEHALDDVIEQYFEANPGLVPEDTQDLGNFKQGLSDDWKAAIDHVWHGNADVEQ